MASGDAENRLNLFRLQILIIDGGLLVLRSILDQTIAAKGLTIRACLDNERVKITQLLGRNVITQDQYDLLFPVGGQDPTSADMDITLITCLLANLKCFGLNKKFKWNVSPVSTDLSLEADICRLRNFRNKIYHISTTTEIDQNKFANLWNEIEQILIRQNTPGLNIHQTIADFKSCSLDPEEERRIDEEIKKCEDYEADVDRLKLEMGDVKENVTELQKNLDDLKEYVIKVRSDLDDLKVNATKVKSDLDDLKDNATEVRRDFRDVKENVAEVQICLDDVKGNVMEVQKDLEEVKRRQQTEKGSGEDFPKQTEEEKYHTSKKKMPILLSLLIVFGIFVSRVGDIGPVTVPPAAWRYNIPGEPSNEMSSENSIIDQSFRRLQNNNLNVKTRKDAMKIEHTTTSDQEQSDNSERPGVEFLNHLNDNGFPLAAIEGVSLEDALSIQRFYQRDDDEPCEPFYYEPGTYSCRYIGGTVECICNEGYEGITCGILITDSDV